MSVRLTLRFRGEQQGLSEVVVELPSSADATAKVTDNDHVINHTGALGQAAGGDQSQPDCSVKEGKDRRAVEVDHRGMWNVLNKQSIASWGGRLGTAA